MSAQDKSPDAFRTISEVADELDLPQHVLRFWETRFNQIKPLKRGGGRRYYRPDDVELLKGIRHLLYGEGYTIKGVQRILKEQGPRFVMQTWHENGSIAAEAAAGSEVAPSVPDGHGAAATGAGPSGERLPVGVLGGTADEATPAAPAGLNILGRWRGERGESDAATGAAGLSREDVRRLQSTLFELLECKRTLDRAR